MFEPSLFKTIVGSLLLANLLTAFYFRIKYGKDFKQ